MTQSEAKFYCFIGERRSNKAIQMKVRWQDGRLAAKQLFDALKAIGLDPSKQIYLNLFVDKVKHTVVKSSLTKIRSFTKKGYNIVGMGRAVQKELAKRGIKHSCLTHPAARGSIRKKERYTNHLKDVLNIST